MSGSIRRSNNLEFLLFGGFQIRRESVPVGLPERRKAVTLLAYLALWPTRAHAREALMELFWPESAPESARQNLSQMLYLIRKSLGEDGLQVSSLTVQLSESVRTDVQRFETALQRARHAPPSERRHWLTEALELANAELFPGFYEDWVLAERDRLDALRAGAEALLKALPERRVILPAYTTRRVGRDTEIAALTEQLRAGCRLLSLVGLGGIGKTRLAVAIGEQLTAWFTDGVVFIDLAPLGLDATEETLWSTLAVTLELPTPGERSAQHAVLAQLTSQHLLLIFDNAEQILGPTATVVVALLARARRLHCLVTSREALRITGEALFSVPALEEDAVALFVDRARLVRPDIVADNHVATLCKQLEGLPLAIEFVAARVRHLSLAELATHLATEGAILSQGERGRPAGRETVRATLEASYALLGPREQEAFAKLSVFSNGWTLPAAETICNAPSEILFSLIDKSLVVAEPQPEGSTRFRYREMVRAYAQEQLDQLTAIDTIRQKHVAYFLEAVEGGSCPHHERENLRAALIHARPEESLRFIAQAAAVIDLLQDFRWQINWARQRLAAIPEAEQGPLYARALMEFSILDNTGACRPLLERAIQLCDLAADREASTSGRLRLAQHLVFVWGKTNAALAVLDDVARDLPVSPIWQFRYYSSFGIATVFSRAHDQALAAFRNANAIAVQEESRSPYWAKLARDVTRMWIATTLHWMGNGSEAEEAYQQMEPGIYQFKGLSLLASRRGDATAARAFGDRAVAEAVQASTDEFPTLLARARVECRLGDFAATRHFLGEALRYADLDQRIDTYRAQVLVDLSQALLGEGCASEAARVLGCLQAQEAREGIAADGADPDPPELLAHALRATLDDASFAQALAEGQSWTVAQGIAYGLNASC